MRPFLRPSASATANKHGGKWNTHKGKLVRVQTKGGSPALVVELLTSSSTGSGCCLPCLPGNALPALPDHAHTRPIIPYHELPDLPYHTITGPTLHIYTTSPHQAVSYHTIPFTTDWPYPHLYYRSGPTRPYHTYRAYQTTILYPVHMPHHTMCQATMCTTALSVTHGTTHITHLRRCVRYHELCS